MMTQKMPLPDARLMAAAHVETIKERSAIKKIVFKGGWGEREEKPDGWLRTTNSSDGTCVVYYNDGSKQTHTGDAGQTVELKKDQYYFSNEGTLQEAS